MATKCTSIQKSLGWCQGTPELPGVKRRIYFLAKSFILGYPQLPRDELGRATSAILTGSYTLAADAKWKYIDILPDKSQLTSEAQGELPSQTQLNKLVAVHPGVGAEASAAAAYINNTDNVFIVEDMKGNFRVSATTSGLQRLPSPRTSVKVPPAPPRLLSTSRRPTKCPRPSLSVRLKPRTATSTAPAKPRNLYAL